MKIALNGAQAKLFIDAYNKMNQAQKVAAETSEHLGFLLRSWGIDQSIMKSYDVENREILLADPPMKPKLEE